MRLQRWKQNDRYRLLKCKKYLVIILIVLYSNSTIIAMIGQLILHFQGKLLNIADEGFHYIGTYRQSNAGKGGGRFRLLLLLNG